MRIAVVIPTYDRPDGRTPFYLARAVNSILNQTYKKYQIYIIGDNYEDESEIKKYAGRAKVYNLPKAKERSVYKEGSYELWCAGGVNAGLTGIKIALKDGISNICHLDHDDWWGQNHLEKIAEMIKKYDPLFCCTLSTHINNWLPDYEITNKIVEYLPIPCGVITSSTCINYAKTKLRPRDVFAETAVTYPADADLWHRLSGEMIEKGQKGYLHTSLNCHHDEERH